MTSIIGSHRIVQIGTQRVALGERGEELLPPDVRRSAADLRERARRAGPSGTDTPHVQLENYDIILPFAGQVMENIVAEFSASPFGESSRPAQYRPSWPLTGGVKIEDNFAPTVIALPPDNPDFKGVIWHEAADIYRADPRGDAAVVAPVSGLAKIFLDNPMGDPPDEVPPYQTAVAIDDEASHVVSVLLHVEPSSELRARADANGFVDVRRGEPIGRLAESLVDIEVADREPLRHTHFMSLNLDRGRATHLNPLDHLPDYRAIDTEPPTIADLYVRGQDGPRHTLPAQPIITDIMAKVYDTNGSGFNLAPRSVAGAAFGLRGGRWEPMWSLPKTDFGAIRDSFEDSAVGLKAKVALDLQAMVKETTALGLTASQFNPNRTFDLALTNLVGLPNGRTDTLPTDAEGHIDLTGLSRMAIWFGLWDDAGNHSSRFVEFPKESEEGTRLIGDDAAYLFAAPDGTAEVPVHDGTEERVVLVERDDARSLYTALVELSGHDREGFISDGEWRRLERTIVGDGVSESSRTLLELMKSAAKTALGESEGHVSFLGRPIQMRQRTARLVKSDVEALLGSS